LFIIIILAKTHIKPLLTSRNDTLHLPNNLFLCVTVFQNLRIIDYSLSQTTLEQVFLSFAALQKNSDLGSALGDSAAVAGGPLPLAYPAYGAPVQFQTQPHRPQ
jgi:hypothetical protein